MHEDDYPLCDNDEELISNYIRQSFLRYQIFCDDHVLEDDKKIHLKAKETRNHSSRIQTKYFVFLFCLTSYIVLFNLPLIYLTIRSSTYLFSCQNVHREIKRDLFF